MSRLSSLRRLDTRDPDVAARDQGRLVQELDGMFRQLDSRYGERLYRGDRIITPDTERPFLKFGELPLVDTSTGNVRVYLPRGKASDAGRVLGFVKRFSNRDVTVHTTDGSFINAHYSYYDNLCQTGIHEFLWDGSGWWFREPYARVRPHTTRHEPVGLWDFGAGTLADSGVNDFDLTVETGTERYAYLAPNLLGFQFDGSTSLWYDVSESKLQLTGDMTFECLWVMHAVVNSAALVSHEASGETEATNCLYLFGTQTFPALQWFSESGGGVNASFVSGYGHPTIGLLTHYAVTRSSNVVQIYVNGRIYGAASSALVTPTGGTDGRLRIGSSLLVRANGIMGSAKLIGTALTAAQIRAEYNHCLGGAYGYLNEF